MSALRTVWANPGLRRLSLVMGASSLGYWGLSTALVVWAYGRGGAGLVAAAGLARMLPAALLAPVLARVLDRLPRGRVLGAAELIRGALTLLAGALIGAGAAAGLVLVPVGIAAVVYSLFNPARASLTPQLADDPEQLAAANATTLSINAAGAFVAPALGGVLLAATSTQVVFWAAGAVMLASASLCRGFDAAVPAASVTAADLDSAPADGPAEPAGVNPAPAAAPAGEPTADGILGALRIVAATPGVRTVLALTAAQCIVAGGLDVLNVATTVKLLHHGSSTVGWIKGALGVGGLLGGLAAARLTRPRLPLGLAVGCLLWGVPLVVLGGLSTTVVAVLAFTVIGVGNTIGDVSGETLLQRLVPDAALGRVFGLLETVVLGAFALGAVIAPLALSVFGTRGALVAIGGALAAAVLASAGALSSLSRATAPAGFERLRALPSFRLLPLPALDAVAARLEPERYAAGALIVRQGDPGDRFFVLDAGAVEVVIDGVAVRRMVPGDAFGEIALLRETPRTATVRALEPVRLFTLAREPFLAAVRGHAGLASGLQGVAVGRLTAFAPAG